MEFNMEKLKALIHYICSRCEPDELGKTKLNKVLWYADLSAYLNFLQSITGETYIKKELGPVSKHILEALRALDEEGRVIERVNPRFFQYAKREYIALDRPDLSLFSAREISLVDEVIDVICRKHTATSISEASHDEIWEAADLDEEIPFCAVLTKRTGKITDRDIRWARECIAEMS